ncbi:MAG TPA: HDOD domain-containing protein [Burkholderiaceae bacterium]|jgi:HD-like signal output (HDOD) protein|nr:HDOD domain-containing protein [Burkholderiaceae bacterium]
MGAIDRFFAAGTVLPTMPEIARRLISSFEDEKVDLRQIVELAEHDHSLAGKILKQANSARYGLSGNVTNLRQAAVLLGLETLRNLVLSATVIGAFPRTPGFERVKFWRHCVATGGYCRWLGRMLGFDSDSAYLAGFLLRSGQILMALELPHMVAAVEAECLRPGLRMSVERQKIGCCHAHVTAELARRWGLPGPMIDAFRHAPDPLHAAQFSLLGAVLNLAATAADAGNLGAPTATALDEAERELLSHLRLETSWLQTNLPSYQSLTYSVDALLA